MEHMISPDKFLEVFGPALVEHLNCQYKREGHVLDLLAASSDFFSVSYHSVSAAMELFPYNNPVGNEDEEHTGPRETVPQSPTSAPF